MPVYQRAHAAAVGQSKGKPTHLCCVRADGLDLLPAAYVPPGLAVGNSCLSGLFTHLLFP